MTVHRSTAPTAVKMGVTTGIYMHTAVSWSTSTRSSGRYRGCIGGQSTSTLSRPERTRVGRYGQRADRRDQLFEASWKGHPGAGVRHGPCSVGAGLRANVGEVVPSHPVTEVPRSAGQPLRLWQRREYPRRFVPVGAAGHGGHPTYDERFTGARDPSVLRDCRNQDPSVFLDGRCSVAADSAVPTCMTGAQSMPLAVVQLTLVDNTGTEALSTIRPCCQVARANILSGYVLFMQVF